MRSHEPLLGDYPPAAVQDLWRAAECRHSAVQSEQVQRPLLQRMHQFRQVAAGGCLWRRQRWQRQGIAATPM